MRSRTARASRMRPPRAMTSTSACACATPDQLDTDLMELAKSPLLRALIAEHRATARKISAVYFEPSPFDKTARTTPAVFSGRRLSSSPPRSLRSTFPWRRCRCVSPIGRAKTSVNSKIGVAISVKPVAPGEAARGLAHAAMTARRLGQKVLGAAGRLQRLHTLFSNLPGCSALLRCSPSATSCIN